MRQAWAKRIPEECGDDGWFWSFRTDRGLECYLGSLPWRDNAQDISCIPFPGTYRVQLGPSNRVQEPYKGKVWRVLDVPGRMDVELHIANFFGEKDKGFHANVQGCFGIGRAIIPILVPYSNPPQLQRGLASSRDAYEALLGDMKGVDWMLNIE